MKLREIGLLGHLMKKWFRQGDVTPPADDPVMQVTYDHIEGVLMTYATCIGVCFAIFTIENLAYLLWKWNSKQRRNRDNLKYSF